MGIRVVVAGYGAVVHRVSHAIVGLIVAHAALIILQTVRLWDKPRNRGQLHGTAHTPNLHRDEFQNDRSYNKPNAAANMQWFVNLCTPLILLNS